MELGDRSSVIRRMHRHRGVHRILGRRDRHRKHRQPTSRVQMGLHTVGELTHMKAVLGLQRLGRRTLHLLGGIGLTLRCSTPGFVHLSGDAPLLVSRGRGVIGAVGGPVVADNFIGTISGRFRNVSHGFPLPSAAEPQHRCSFEHHSAARQTSSTSLGAPIWRNVRKMSSSPTWTLSWDNGHMLTWVRRAAMAAAAIGCCGALTAAPAAADADLDLRHHPAPAVAPGIAIATYDANHAGVVVPCTAGWLVHDANGNPGVLTAGHCYVGGGAIYWNTIKGAEGIGRFTEHVYEGTSDEDEDIAVIGINNVPTPTGPVATDTRIIGIRPVTAPADPARLAKGQQLCHYGLATGPPPQCGPITYITPTKVVFAAPAAEGDSGGPVYYRNADGTATPVGIHIRGDSSSTVAELVGPWLDKWHLTVDTTPSSPAAPVGYQQH
ncbi:S1 family peptidase [Mycobacterium avium]|nr:S1 family peptidase [Mycobacterium avium]